MQIHDFDVLENIQDKAKVANMLKSLTKVPGYVNLLATMKMTLVREKVLLTDDTITIIIHYLNSKKNSLTRTADSDFALRILNYIAQLHTWSHILIQLRNKNPAQCIAACDAIQFGISGHVINMGGLQNLDVKYLSDEASVNLLNRLLVDSYLKDKFLALNYLAKEFPEKPVAELLVADIIDNKVKEIISKRLELLGFKQDSLDDQRVLFELPEEWFKLREKKTITDIKANLHKDIFSTFGLRYFLKHFKPEDMAPDYIPILNLLIQLFITSGSKDEWQALEDYCFHDDDTFYTIYPICEKLVQQTGKDGQFLLALDLRYLKNKAMITYLERFSKENKLTESDVNSLNDAAEELFGKLTLHDTMPSILESLPRKFFAREEFPPQVFSKIPKVCLEPLICSILLIEYADNIKPSDFNGGTLTMKFDEFKAILETCSKKPETIQSYFNSDGFLGHLNDQREHKDFESLLNLAANYFTAENYNYLTSKENKYPELCLPVYRFVSINDDQRNKFPREFSQLRSKVREKLTKSSIELPELVDFKNKTKIPISILEKSLDSYKKYYTVEKNGKIEAANFWLSRVSNESLNSYKALHEALAKQETAFLDILHTIRNQKVTSDYVKPLSDYTNTFELSAIELRSPFYGIFDMFLADEDKFHEALLNDFFYSSFTYYSTLSKERNLIEDILKNDNACNIFFNIIDTYRPRASKTYAEYRNRNGNGSFNNSTSHTIASLKEKEKELSVNPLRGSNLQIKYFLEPSDLPKKSVVNTSINTVSNEPVTETRKLKRPDQVPNTHLLDVDLLAGIQIILPEWNKPTANSMLIPSLQHLVTDKDNKDVFDYIEEFSLQHKSKICFGIMVTHNTRYMNIFVYTNLKNETSIIVLDPAYKDNIKEQTGPLLWVNNLISQYPNWERTLPLISEQLNDSDYGISCLQNIYDFLHKNSVTVENETLAFHDNKVTLNGEKYIGEDHKFQELTLNTRNEWETKLRASRKVCIPALDGKAYTTAYSYVDNVFIQKAIPQAENLLSNIVDKFQHKDSCEFVSMVSQPGIANAPTSLPSAYFRFKSELYYFDKLSNECTLVPDMTPSKMHEFDKEMSHLKKAPRILSDKLLSRIAEITGHTREQNYTLVKRWIKDKKITNLYGNIVFETFIANDEDCKTYFRYVKTLKDSQKRSPEVKVSLNENTLQERLLQHIEASIADEEDAKIKVASSESEYEINLNGKKDSEYPGLEKFGLNNDNSF